MTEALITLEAVVVLGFGADPAGPHKVLNMCLLWTNAQISKKVHEQSERTRERGCFTRRQIFGPSVHTIVKTE